MTNGKESRSPSARTSLPSPALPASYSAVSSQERRQLLKSLFCSLSFPAPPSVPCERATTTDNPVVPSGIARWPISTQIERKKPPVAAYGASRRNGTNRAVANPERAAQKEDDEVNGSCCPSCACLLLSVAGAARCSSSLERREIASLLEPRTGGGRKRIDTTSGPLVVQGRKARSCLSHGRS